VGLVVVQQVAGGFEVAGVGVLGAVELPLLEAVVVEQLRHEERGLEALGASGPCRDGGR